MKKIFVLSAVIASNMLLSACFVEVADAPGRPHERAQMVPPKAKQPGVRPTYNRVKLVSDNKFDHRFQPRSGPAAMDYKRR